MKRHFKSALGVASIFCALASTAGAGDAEEYNRRVAERIAATFHALDRNGDGQLTVQEVLGDVEMQPRFNDLDINRDGTIVAAELERYLRLRFGVSIESAKARAPGPQATDGGVASAAPPALAGTAR